VSRSFNRIDVFNVHDFKMIVWMENKGGAFARAQENVVTCLTEKRSPLSILIVNGLFVLMASSIDGIHGFNLSVLVRFVEYCRNPQSGQEQKLPPKSEWKMED